MERVERSGRTLAYSVAGSGPWLVIPWCNIAWFDFTDLTEITRRHTVVVASPFGFGHSGRSDNGSDYSGDDLVDDLLHVCEVVGADEFAVFGYSFSGALAAWMACSSDRVTCAVAGGFPLLGSYAAVRDEVERLIRDPVMVSQVSTSFDPRAAASFYRDLAERRDGDLVERRRCPMMTFWGEDDVVLQAFDTTRDLRRELEARGVRVVTLDGLGHDDVLLHLDPVLETASRWIAESHQRPHEPS